jgi:hypothetical protein
VVCARRNRALEFGKGVAHSNIVEVNLTGIAGSFHTSLETNPIYTAVGSKSEIELFTTPPPMWFVARIRTDNDCFVPIPRLEVTILISDRIAMHSRVVVARTSRSRPSGKAENANRRSAARAVVVNVETNTSVRLFAHNLITVWGSDHKRGEVIGVLLALLILLIVAVSA